MKRDGAVDRVGIRLPTPLMDEVAKIVEKSPLYKNRQEFVEAALRDAIIAYHEYAVMTYQEYKGLVEKEEEPE